MWLFYERRGFVAHYDWAGVCWSSKSEPVPMCPTVHQLFNIDLYMQSPDNVDPLEDLIKVDDMRYPRSGPSGETQLSLQASTGWDIDRFYKTFVQKDTRACMDTPADLWPSR